MSLPMGLRVMAEAPWSTKAVEESHGSLSAVHRLHPDLTGEQFGLRAYMHACRFLVSEDVEDKSLARMDKAKQVLSRKRPRKVSGVNAYVSAMVAELKKKQHAGTRIGKKQMTQIIAFCAQKYPTLPEAVQSRYSRVAEEEGSARARELLAEIEGIESDMELFRERQKQERAAVGIRHRLSDLKLTAGDLDDVSSRYHAGGVTLRDIELDRANQVAPAEKPPQGRMELLARVVPGSHEETHAGNITAFTRQICIYRDLVRCLGFSIDGGGDHMYLMLFATQSPMRAFFMPTTMGTLVPPDYARLPQHQRRDAESGVPEWLFTFTQGQYCTDRHIGDPKLEDVFVWTGLTFGAGDCLATWSEPVPWMVFSERLSHGQIHMHARCLNNCFGEFVHHRFLPVC